MGYKQIFPTVIASYRSPGLFPFLEIEHKLLLNEITCHRYGGLCRLHPRTSKESLTNSAIIIIFGGLKEGFFGFPSPPMG
jgi:hypothetical protein